VLACLAKALKMAKVGVVLTLLFTFVYTSPLPSYDEHLDVVSAGFVRTVGEWFGLPNPVHVAIYLVVLIVLVIALIILMCYGINCMYVMLFVLLSFFILALFLVIWYWIGIDPEDIPEFTMVKESFNSTKVYFDAIGKNKTTELTTVVSETVAMAALRLPQPVYNGQAFPIRQVFRLDSYPPIVGNALPPC
jgi:hypothetical protein